MVRRELTHDISNTVFTLPDIAAVVDLYDACRRDLVVLRHGGMSLLGTCGRGCAGLRRFLLR
jgi:hypothetical protein